MNAVQETLLNPIEEAGLTPAKAAPYDLLTQAIAILSSAAAMPPVGTVFAFDDFNGALTFDTEYYAYCNGQTKVVAGIGSQVIRDMSGRYLVGFGTDGGQDLDDSFALAFRDPVGNAGHAINIQHYHAGPSHVHAGPSHVHAVGKVVVSGSVVYHVFYKGTFDSAPYTGLGMANTNNVQYGTTGQRSVYRLTSGSIYDGDFLYSSYSGTGDTGAGGTGNTSPTLSTAQSIQPRSQRVRYIMRIK
jgi:hypothetical protein